MGISDLRIPGTTVFTSPQDLQPNLTFQVGPNNESSFSNYVDPAHLLTSTVQGENAQSVGDGTTLQNSGEIEPFIENIASEDFDVRFRAVSNLSIRAAGDYSIDIRSRLVEPLIIAANDGDPKIRETAVLGLLHLAMTPEIDRDLRGKMVDPLIALVTTPNEHLENIYWDATDALGFLAQSDIEEEQRLSCIKTLSTSCLGDASNASVRRSSANTLVKILRSADVRYKEKIGESVLSVVNSGYTDERGDFHINNLQDEMVAVISEFLKSDVSMDAKWAMVDGIITRFASIGKACYIGGHAACYGDSGVEDLLNDDTDVAIGIIQSDIDNAFKDAIAKQLIDISGAPSHSGVPSFGHYTDYNMTPLDLAELRVFEGLLVSNMSTDYRIWVLEYLTKSMNEWTSYLQDLITSGYESACNAFREYPEDLCDSPTYAYIAQILLRWQPSSHVPDSLREKIGEAVAVYRNATSEQSVREVFYGY